MHYLKHIITWLICAMAIATMPTQAFCQIVEQKALTEFHNELLPRELNNCDTVNSQFSKFSPQQLIVPGVLMVSGIVGAFDCDNNLNLSVRDAMCDLSNGKHCKLDDYLRFAPSAAHLLIGSIGVKSKHNFKERLLISATAHAAMLVLGYSTKYLVNERRPDLSNNHSFPSGHVAMAFTGAELLRSEYGTAYGIAGYAIATGVAFLRLYNNKHWLNDVLMGAGLGILSARIGNWLLPLNRKLFKINKKRSSTSTITAMPFYNIHDRACMIAITSVF